MGKVNKKRGHGRRNKGHSVVSPVTNQLIDASTNNSKDDVDFLDNLIDVVNRAESDEQKECSLAALANLTQEKETILKLLNKGVVKKLGPFLIDSSLHIKEKIAGTFRNMSAVGGVEACQSMVDNDVMTCIGYVIKKETDELFKLKECENYGKKFQHMLAYLKELVTLLWNLCESSSVAVELVNKDQLVVHLAQILSTKDFDADLVIAAAQCLYTVTEDNNDAVACLVNNTTLLERFAELMKEQICNGKQMLIASLVSGIMCNLRKSLPENACNQIIDETLNIVSIVLEAKTSDCIKSVTEKEASNIEETFCYFSSQQMCLELLANLLCTNDDDDEWEEIDDSDENYDFENMEGGEDNMEVDDTEVKKNEELLMFSILIKKAIPAKILPFIENPNRDTLSVIEDTNLKERILQALHRVQQSALVCFSNLLSVCPADVIGDADCLELIWLKVMNLATSTNGGVNDQNGLSMVDELTGLLRAVAMKMAESNDCRFITPQNLQTVGEWYNRISIDSAKCNLLKIFGVAGKLIAEKESFLPLLEDIGKILCSALNASNSVIIICEALDAVFDAFAENGKPDNALVSSGLAKELCRLPPQLKAKIKSEKLAIKEHLPLINMSRTNLIRFIKYKSLK